MSWPVFESERLLLSAFLNRNERFDRIWRSITVGLIACLGLFVVAWFGGIRVVETASVPPGIWWVHNGSVARADYISACLPLKVAKAGRGRGYLDWGICPGGAAPVMKRVVGVPGDVVTLTTSGLWVNGVLEGRSRTQVRDLQGRAVLRLVSPGRYVVSPGEFWVMGDAQRSWDSRYFGAVSARSVLGIGTPLFVGVAGV